MSTKQPKPNIKQKKSVKFDLQVETTGPILRSRSKQQATKSSVLGDLSNLVANGSIKNEFVLNKEIRKTPISNVLLF
jgi:hypothetical protein